MRDPLLINASSPKPYKSRYKKEIKKRLGLNSTHACQHTRIFTKDAVVNSKLSCLHE